MCKTIIHVIDSLGIGGAEQVLRGSVRQMTDYKHVIVALNEPIIKRRLADDVIIHELKHKSKRDSLQTVIRLKHIINEYKPFIIHSHLFWSTIFSRICKPQNIPLASSYHSMLYDKNSSQYSWKMLIMDKLTSSRSDFHFYVSKGVKKMYETKVTNKVKGMVLYNFYDPVFSRNKEEKSFSKNRIEIIAIGNNRPEKDYATLYSALNHLPKNYSTTIVGAGFDKTEKSNKVIYKGNASVSEELHGKSLFISTSTHEGFGISVIEAMASGLPCVLSNIPTFVEIAGQSAVFFEKGDPKDLAGKIEWITSSKDKLGSYTDKSVRCAKRFTLSKYIEQIEKAYKDLS